MHPILSHSRLHKIVALTRHLYKIQIIYSPFTACVSLRHLLHQLCHYKVKRTLTQFLSVRIGGNPQSIVKVLDLHPPG